MKLAPLLASGIALLALLVSKPLAQAACLGPDNLQGPCCAPTFANLPAFPGFSLPGVGLCWGQCTPTAQPQVKVVLAAPTLANCGEYGAQLSVIDTAGLTGLSGVLRMDYTRTWFEFHPSGTPVYQVWRFVVKGDLNGSPPPTTCPTPTCIGPFPTAFFYGYIDYALDCSSGIWENTLVLYHGCDRFMHQPGLSATPGAFHPGISYAVVAPSTTVNPFVPVASPYFSGPLVAEALRNTGPIPGAIACSKEEPISGGLHLLLGSACACPLNFAFIMHSANLLQGAGSCPDSSGVPSNFTALNVPGTPWLWEIKSSLGRWTNPVGTYPGDEAVWVDEGAFAYHNSCASTATVPDSVDIFYGASTAFGFAVSPSDPGVLTDKFIDMASNYSTPVGVPVVFPILGTVFPSRHLIYVNLP